MKSFCYTLILFVVLLVFNVPFVNAEDNTEIDSLQNRLITTTNDTAKIDILIKLAEKTSWSDIKSSEKYAKQALLLSQQINYEKGLAYSKFRLASIFIDFDFKLTEELILESLEHAQHLKDSLLMARIYNSIGNLKDNLEETEDALSYYKKSLQIYQAHNKDSLAAGVYNNLGIIYKALSNDSLSEVYYLKAAEINTRTKKYLWLAINYVNIGSDLIESGNLEKGYSYITKSLDLAKNNNFPRVIPWIYNNLSQYYFTNREYSKSIDYAKLALKIARDQVNRIQERAALIHLKDSWFKKDDFLNAFKYSELINTVNDSINKYSKLKELDLLEMRYKFEEERKAQKLESELLKAKNSRKELRYILIILGAGIVILIFVFLYILQRNRNSRKSLKQKTTLLEKEKLSKDLEFKNKELTTNVMYLLKKNEFISTISDKLKNTSFDSNDKNSNIIGRIISELDKSISDDNWEDFEVRFQEVHVGFYNHLSKEFPALTPNELRLCAFLRLNMTSKEITGITFQSADSLKTARYRLRKKLTLSREENLIAFLTKL
jgi:tetratricopeptide (TPR) repeat protein